MAHTFGNFAFGLYLNKGNLLLFDLNKVILIGITGATIAVFIAVGFYEFAARNGIKTAAPLSPFSSLLSRSV